MKLKLTPKRLAANKANGLLGGIVRRENQAAKYAANPTYCKHCNVMLLQEKKNNKFCSKSCAASHNNKVTPKRVAILYKCAVCDNKFKGEGKYCSIKCCDFGRRKYKTEDEAKEATRKKNRAVSAKYRASVRNQTPADADITAIREFYDNCPK